MNRRKFFTYSGAGTLAIAGGSIMNTGCWLTGNVFNSIMGYISVGLQAFSAVTQLLTGSGVITATEGTAIATVINLVKVGFADLQTAVANYENAPAAQKATLMGKVSTALADLEGVIQQFWNDLQIPDVKLANLIQGLLGIILSTLSGFATQLPAPAGVKARVLAKTIVVPPQKRSQKQFKKDFNQILKENGYSQYEVN